LILLQETKNQENTFLLVDKYSGEIQHYIKDQTWFGVIYLTEDRSDIYLTASLKPEKPGAVNIRSQVVRIEKQTFSMTEIPIGQNIDSLQFKIFSQDNFVFIPTYQRIGGYTLPGT